MLLLSETWIWPNNTQAEVSLSKTEIDEIEKGPSGIHD